MTLLPPPPSADEHFYARALAILAGPTRRMALLMRLVNIAYWVAVLSALGWLVGQGLDRDPPVTVVATTLLTPAVRSGEPVRIRYAFIRHRTCETDTAWLVFDGAQEVTRFGPVHARRWSGHGRRLPAWRPGRAGSASSPHLPAPATTCTRSTP